MPKIIVTDPDYWDCECGETQDIEHWDREPTKAEKQKYRDDLLEMLPPGTTVHAVLRHVSRSGMTRWIDLYFIEDGHPHWLSYRAAAVMDQTFDKRRECIKIGGCGMDMGFALVYNLSRALYPDGYGCIGEGCPANDHFNGHRDYTPHDKAKERECPGCKGEGSYQVNFLYGEPRIMECRTCQGKGRLEAGNWHNDGGYALKHRWI